MAETLEIDVSDEERVLVRKDGGPLERSLFEKVYDRDFNSLEKETAWYLDSRQCVHWWQWTGRGEKVVASADNWTKVNLQLDGMGA